MGSGRWAKGSASAGSAAISTVAEVLTIAGSTGQGGAGVEGAKGAGPDGAGCAVMARPAPGAGHLKNFSSTEATSVMLWGRTAGFLVSMRPMRLSMACGTAGSRDETAGGVSVVWAMISSPAPSRTKGGRPHSISNRMQPNE